MLLPQIAGCAVLTVEGLAAADGTLHPVQQAMVDADATQCGFCTPGFAMAMFAFHHGGEPADDTLIHDALAGNLCRCTGYRSIVEACRRIARGPADRFAAEAPVTAGALRQLAAVRGLSPRRAGLRRCRARSTRCLRRWRSIPARSSSPAAPISGCAPARIAKRFPR